MALPSGCARGGDARGSRDRPPPHATVPVVGPGTAVKRARMGSPPRTGPRSGRTSEACPQRFAAVRAGALAASPVAVVVCRRPLIP